MRAGERIFSMAGPLSSEEIEDVVSSVRRLVSNEQRPRTLSRDLNSERLLLTPAQRVMPETSPLAPLMLDASLQEARASDVTEAPAEAPVEPATEADSLAETPAEDDEGTTLLYVAADSDPDADPDDVVLPGVDPELAADLAEAVAEEPEVEWEDEIWVEPATVSLGEAALAAEEAEVLTGPAPDDAMPSGDVMDDPAEPWAQAGSDLGDDEPIPFVPLRRRAEHLAARLAAGEVMETPKADAEAEIVSLTVDTPQEPAATPHTAASVEASVGTVATEFVDADGMALAVLDEAALHEIVRQTLRAELQGELGERITRNVRKLVRAEINRALMARDLD
ncbi:hypothetical protein [Rhodobacter sp. SY28-1]|uniref:hypothetical protein n=1 Tax=Rhodobacter sp. SY28-1 TaxID=2562317 RepID=UPI0010BFC619|nr:hypothetical protein [Rhodobacter sp. SY28-1]